MELEATYENGIFKLDRRLPLDDGQRVRLTVHAAGGRARASAGLFRWKGDDKDLELLLGPENHPWAENR